MKCSVTNIMNVVMALHEKSCALMDSFSMLISDDWTNAISRSTLIAVIEQSFVSHWDLFTLMWI